MHTLHRIAHALPLSTHICRASLKIELSPPTQCEARRAPLKQLFWHPRASCFIRTRFGRFPLPQRLSSLLLPSRGDEHPPDPRTAGQFGRLATQSPLTRGGGGEVGGGGLSGGAAR